MQNRQETYYLTILGPACGERVIASVITADRKLAENLFACGKLNDKGFMLNGMYSEEEVLHMFKPHTDIAGTFNAVSGGCEQHRDYHKVPVFVIKENKVYRLKGDKQFLLDITEKDNNFDHVYAVISGKVKPVEVTRSVRQDTAPVKPASAVSKSDRRDAAGLFSVDKIVSFSESIDADTAEPDFEEDADIFDADMGEPELIDDPKPEAQTTHIYDMITPDKSSAKASFDSDYISEFDSTFYGAQKTVAASDEFQKNEKLQERFDNNSSGQPIRRQGQSLKDLFGKKLDTGEFKI